jgi:hypothetical protein
VVMAGWAYVAAGECGMPVSPSVPIVERGWRGLLSKAQGNYVRARCLR